jgi:hypothetical protein
MKSLLSFFILLVILYCICGCTSLTTAGVSVTDTVLDKGMIISLDSPECLSINIAAGDGLERHYTWNGITSSTNLIPRREKWYGALGAYFPGNAELWNRQDHVYRLIANEAVINYTSYEQLLCAISSKDNNCQARYYVMKEGKLDLENTMTMALESNSCSAYTNDGLYVSAKTADGPGNGRTLYAIIYRLLVNGESVHNLPNSSNQRIKITYQDTGSLNKGR